MYRYLFFDADGTLFDFHEAENRAFFQMADHLGFCASEAQMHKYKACNQACWQAFEQSLITQTELKTKRFASFFASENLDFDPALASDAYQYYLAQQGILYKESLPVLDALIERGYTLFLATNGIAEVQHGRIAQSRTRSYFKDIFISEELGSQKPEQAFFSHMLEKTGLEAKKRECLMIGDSLTSDIKGGVLSGIDTLWLNMDSKLTNSTTIKPTYEMHSLSGLLDLLTPLY